ncbi:ArsR/SmtB family transcription factor [Burkholderiaceae bacterium UC74_6]
MVNYELELDAVFAALSNAGRRCILSRLERAGDQSVSELAEPLGIKLPAMLKQLGVLEDAGLITRHKDGRTVQVSLAAGPLGDATDWLRRYERFWSPRLDRLAVAAESIESRKRKVRP